MSGTTGKQWEQLLNKYNPKEESIGSFCKRHDIKEGAYYYWRSKLALQKTEPVNMLRVITADAELPACKASLLMPNGINLIFSIDADSRFIADILRALW